MAYLTLACHWMCTTAQCLLMIDGFLVPQCKWNQFTWLRFRKMTTKWDGIWNVCMWLWYNAPNELYRIHEKTRFISFPFQHLINAMFLWVWQKYAVTMERRTIFSWIDLRFGICWTYVLDNCAGFIQNLTYSKMFFW